MSVHFTNLAKWKINDFEIKYPSLAGTATTVSYPVKTSHRFYSEDALKEAGITPGQL